MDATHSYSCPDALGRGDPPPVRTINPAATRPILLIADHAGNAVPAVMNCLGLADEDLVRHIAWDPGAGAVAEELANRWQATAVLAQYSRLIVDLNRPLGDPTAMPEVSDGTEIPANQDLADDERARRANLLYFPYHQDVDTEIARLRLGGPGPIVVSIHSFTPDYGAENRPWHVGIMAATDRRLADRLLDRLRRDPGLVVGDNDPYSGVTHGYSLRLHGGSQGLANAQIEIRQDLLINDKDVTRWADMLDDALSPLIDDPALQSIAYF